MTPNLHQWAPLDVGHPRPRRRQRLEGAARPPPGDKAPPHQRTLVRRAPKPLLNSARTAPSVPLLPPSRRPNANVNETVVSTDSLTGER